MMTVEVLHSLQDSEKDFEQLKAMVYGAIRKENNGVLFPKGLLRFIAIVTSVMNEFIRRSMTTLSSFSS